jgi:hypothetical protein
MVKKSNKKSINVNTANFKKILQPIDSYTKDYYMILKEKERKSK